MDVTNPTTLTDTDIELTELLDGIVGRLHGEHVVDLANLFDLDVAVVSVVLQLGLALAFERLEVAAAVDDSLRTHLTALLRFVFDNPQTEFYKSPDYRKEQRMSDNTERKPFNFDWDPDWHGPGGVHGAIRVHDPGHVRPPLRFRPDNPFPEPDWYGVDRYRPDAPVSEPVVTPRNNGGDSPWPPPTTEQENP